MTTTFKISPKFSLCSLFGNVFELFCSLIFYAFLFLNDLKNHGWLKEGFLVNICLFWSGPFSWSTSSWVGSHWGWVQRRKVWHGCKHPIANFWSNFIVVHVSKYILFILLQKLDPKIWTNGHQSSHNFHLRILFIQLSHGITWRIANYGWCQN